MVESVTSELSECAIDTVSLLTVAARDYACRGRARGDFAGVGFHLR